ncbi:MAG: response regulator transcription factor [Fusobacteriaceae bacterium]
MKKKILIIEDERDLAKILTDFLKSENFEVINSYDGDEGLDVFYTEKPDIIILDINLPKKNGWEVCSEIKENSNIPIIMMTARNSEFDELQGLELGADDYITKPFSLKILLARIKKTLKIDGSGIYSYKDFQFDMRLQVLFIRGEKIDISGRESQLLEYFVRNKKIVLTREKILNEIWGFDFYGDDRVVDTLVKRIRKKMLEYSLNIKTIRGVGYIFEEI